MEPDDFVAPMSIETYFEYRVKQALKVSQKEVAERVGACISDPGRRYCACSWNILAAQFQL